MLASTYDGSSLDVRVGYKDKRETNQSKTSIGIPILELLEILEMGNDLHLDAGLGPDRDRTLDTYSHFVCR